MLRYKTTDTYFHFSAFFDKILKIYFIHKSITIGKQSFYAVEESVAEFFFLRYMPRKWRHQNMSTLSRIWANVSVEPLDDWLLQDIFGASHAKRSRKDHYTYDLHINIRIIYVILIQVVVTKVSDFDYLEAF